MRVALVVDNPYRDLPGLVLLATRLVQRGVTVHLVPMYCQGELIQLAPDFVLLNYLRRNNEAVAAQLLECDIRLGIHDTEGGIIVDPRLHALALALDPQVRQGISRICSWGPQQAAMAVREGWYREEQLTVTGACRFDFYARRLRPAAQKFADYAARYPQPLVLFNGTFTLCNPGFQTPEAEVEMLVQRFQYSRERVLGWQRAQAETMKGMVAMANRFAERFPHVTFVFRPHPFENRSTYAELLHPHKNLHMVKEGTVDSWILRSSAVIQHSCTTGIEAGMAGIPTLMPAWLPSGLEMPHVEAVSDLCASEDALEERLAAILQGNAPPSPELQAGIDRVVGEWFFRSDGKAHERTADAIMGALPGGGRGGRLRRCRYFAHGLDRTKRKPLSKAHARICATLGLPLHWSFRRWRPEPVRGDFAWWKVSEKHFGLERVQELLAAILPCVSEEVRAPIVARQSAKDYPFGYPDGQSVTIGPG